MPRTVVAFADTAGMTGIESGAPYSSVANALHVASGVP